MTYADSARLSAIAIAMALAGYAPGAFAQVPSGCSQATGAAAPAKKKGFGGFLKAAANTGLQGLKAAATGGGEAALEAAAQRATDNAMTDAIDCAADGAVAVASTPSTSTAGDASSAPRDSMGGKSAQRTAAAASYSYPSELPKPADFAAVKQAYDDFGKVDCMECEGGYAYDGWPVFPRDEWSSKYNGDAQRLGGYAVGHVHRWQGTEAAGTLTVVAEQAVGGFRCRTLQYRLTKGKAHAARPGLLCWGRANQFAGSESWNQVY